MFESIESLARTHNIEVPPERADILPQQRREQRLEVAQKVIRVIAEKNKVANAKPISVAVVEEREVSLFNESNSKTCIVGISPFYLIKESELKTLGEMQEKNPEEVASLVHSKLGYSGQETTLTEKKHAERFIQWRKNADLTSRTKQITFIFAHELGHIHHQHKGFKVTALGATLELLPFVISAPVILGLVGIFLGLAFAAPALLPVLAIPLLLGIVLILGIDISILRLVRKQVNYYKELQADAFAAKAVGVEGGIASLEFSKKFSRNKAHHSHPTPSKRIEQLERIMQEQLASNEIEMQVLPTT